MILHPSILALFVSSLLISLLLLYSSYHGILILNRWDIKSGSEQQISLERRTYLISTILTYVFGFQLISLFLFIYTADTLHTFFAGAMCAVGVLNVNAYGYPALLLKMLNFIVAGLWLILNYADSKAYDYPLIKNKYRLLIALTPFIIAETVLQTGYFLGLKADVITSCCGSLFSGESKGVASEMASMPSISGKIVFYSMITLTLATGAYFYVKRKGGYIFSALCGASFVVSIVSIISFFCLYYYELPSHHCPFCILQKEYGYAGYFLYLLLFGGTVAGIGTGILMPFRSIPSLREYIPVTQRKLVVLATACFFVFTLLVTLRMVFTNFRLEGY